MQLPDYLLRTYRRYKESEESLLKWIPATAPDVSASSHSCSNDNEKQQPFKLKGQTQSERRRKVRSTSKEAMTKSSSPENTPSSKIYLYDILPRIKAIACNPRIVTTPADIVSIFKTILQLHQRRIAWFKSNTSQHNSKTIRANQNYLCPILILQNALKSLAGKISPDNTAEDQSPTKDKKSKDKREKHIRSA